MTLKIKVLAGKMHNKCGGGKLVNVISNRNTNINNNIETNDNNQYIFDSTRKSHIVS